MTSCDTNILFPACKAGSPQREAARAFLADHEKRSDFCICEQVLLELYSLLRNPTVCERPLPSAEAVRVVHRYRSNPNWPVVDIVLGSEIMDVVWEHASEPRFPYGRIYDARLAATLRHHGVTHFATSNERDFLDFGFEHVWNPLAT